MKKLRVVAVAMMFGTVSLLAAEKKFDIPVVKAEPSGKPIVTDAPVGPTFGPVMCDDRGSIYFRYFPVDSKNTLSSGLARISSSGQFTQITMAAIPNIEKSAEVYFYAVASDGKIFEIVRHFKAPEEGHPGVSQAYLAVFDKDGSLVKSHALGVEVFPNFLVPLNNGELFMGGTRIDIGPEGIKSKEPFLGIFSDDGSVKHSFTRPKVNLTEEERASGTVDPAIHGGAAVLGPDGAVYLLLANIPPRVQVISPSGQVLREFTPNSSLKEATSSKLFVSGGRLLLAMYGKDESGRNSLVWVVYNAQTGEPISAYAPPEKSGRAACWVDGKRLEFLGVNSGTGQFEIVGVDVQ